ncbi:Vacuolar protein sorting-associated protein 33A [Neofusicoccum parvum]|uniref:Vacuolar protein sorting-associated protein 33A n=1 Tax=Neofusicoccum parvum TaxID=310453 RepID=A0ACB5RPF8_9PEZI|nr:Vacuolar protein sorting-associated protein 33A [Neofusicoccum parvum]
MAPQAAINAADISDAARRSLLLLLEGIRGKKNLVFEKALSGPLNLLLKFSTLQEYGVDKPFFLENGNVDSSQRNVVFIARGDKAKTALAIAEQIKKLRHNGIVNHEFSVFWVPRRTLVSDQVLEEAGVLGEVNVAEWPLNFVPLSNDLLSLELEDSVTDLYVVARRLQSSYENRNIQQKTTSELREFVTKLPGFQQEQASLKLHTNLAEEIIKHTRSDIFSRVLEVQQNLAAGADPSSQHDNIDELISRGVKVETVLRLLCLESSLHGGLRPRDLETFKRAVLQAYGHQHILTLTSLEKAGLLIPRSGGLGVGANLGGSGARTNVVTNYNQVRRSLSLIVDEVNEAEPDDIAYVFSGYAPLSIRLVQCVLQKDYINSLASARPANNAQGQQQASGALANAQGWRPFEDVLRYIRGATVDEVQAGEEKAVRARQLLNGSGGGGEGKTVVVFFLGGVTRAEASALRFVAKSLAEEGRGRRLVVATTSVIKGDKVVGSAIEKGTLGGTA